MSEIMETTSDAHHSRSKNKFKFTSFPDYVRKVQQLSFSQTTTISNGEKKTLPGGIKKQNLSRAFSCFTTSSNSPNLPCKTPDVVKQPRLPPLHAGRRRQVKELQLKRSPNSHQDNTGSGSNDSTPLRAPAVEHLRTRDVAIHRASSFPLVSDSSKVTPVQHVKPKQVMSKSPYLQPLVHKTYYHKQTPKGQRRKRVKQQQKLTTATDRLDEPAISDGVLPVPSITLRAATPSSNSDDMSTSLADQFTARKQLAAELDKLNKEIQDIVVSVEQVE